MELGNGLVCVESQFGFDFAEFGEGEGIGDERVKLEMDFEELRFEEGAVIIFWGLTFGNEKMKGDGLLLFTGEKLVEDGFAVA